MASLSTFRFLRPSAQSLFSASTRRAHARFYTVTQSLKKSQAKELVTSHVLSRQHSTAVDYAEQKAHAGDVTRRILELVEANALEHPRIKPNSGATTCSAFRQKYSPLRPDQAREGDSVTLRGRIHSTRVASSKLVFVDIVQDGCRVQALCDFSKVRSSEEEFKNFYKLARRGDIISITGFPCRTKRGELSLSVTAIPLILSPSFMQHPTVLDDTETRIKNRHADLLINQRASDTLRLRSHIIQYLRDFFLRDSFLEVQTPILAASAGGAVARPFTTTATEFTDKTLSLRIAPEIWLKRLIIGGMDRVFEIGQVFRNEGLDATHNPEFTTLEFYKSYADLDELMFMTESMISGLALQVNRLIDLQFPALDPCDSTMYTAPFNRIEFIPTLESILGKELPNLTDDDATPQLIAMFSSLSLPIPSNPTLPRLLDKLCSYYLEARCASPTFITHHPACLAPLAKSFLDPVTNQVVSARAELFINHREIANMYEEENSPVEQRMKFEQQIQWRDDDNVAAVDESYLDALMWGMPPTGGWGAGIDRLVMLFSGSKRIGDVLAFGTLKHVVGLAQEKGWAHG